jgi:hypothetical protein
MVLWSVRVKLFLEAEEAALAWILSLLLLSRMREWRAITQIIRSKGIKGNFERSRNNHVVIRHYLFFYVFAPSSCVFEERCTNFLILPVYDKCLWFSFTLCLHSFLIFLSPWSFQIFYKRVYKFHLSLIMLIDLFLNLNKSYSRPQHKTRQRHSFILYTA